MTKPIIGITLDYVAQGSFSKRPHFALREQYFNAVANGGGIPMGIPHDPQMVDEVLDRIDGIIIPGGDFGLEPNWYVEGEKPAFPASKRLQFDIEIIKKSLTKKIPLLGICAGMQILAGMHGCKLSSNIHKHSTKNYDHLKFKPAEEYAHHVTVAKSSLLHKIVGKDEFEVNSRHTEGVVWPSDKITVSGTSDDGIIEAIEVKGSDYALGVQWHPEFFLQDANAAIFKSLVNQASK